MICGMSDSPKPSAVKHNVDEKNRKRFESDKSKVLVYDAEDGETTRRFIEAFKKLLVEDFEVKDFAKADNEERDTLFVIAVVRKTSIRFEESLRQINGQLHKDAVKDMKRVIIIYFCMNETEKEEISDMIRFMSKSFNFAKVVKMDFIDYKLELSVWRYLFQGAQSHAKELNEIAIRELKECLKVTDWYVNVYYAMDEQLVKQFIMELRQAVSSYSIRIQEAQPIEELENITASTLILTTGHEKLTINDWKKVIVIVVTPRYERYTTMYTKQDDPNSMENSSSVNTIENNAAQHAGNESCQQYRKIWKIFNDNGEIYIPILFLRDFKNFVRTCSM